MPKIHSRDNFPADVIKSSKMRAAYICSKPDCRAFTIAPSVENDLLVQYSGKVAHINAASKGGPRYEPAMTQFERTSIENALFLCSNCAELIDKNNGMDYPTTILRSWKEQHFKWVLENLNKSLPVRYEISIRSSHQLGGITANTVNINSSPGLVIDRNKQHDYETYLRVAVIIDEDFVEGFYKTIMNNADCTIDGTHQLDTIFSMLKKTSNSFLNPQLDVLRLKLLEALPPLINFISTHFDKWPYDQKVLNFTIQLHPDYLRDTSYKKMKWEDRQRWE